MHWQRKPDDEMRSMATKQAATPADHQNRDRAFRSGSTRDPSRGSRNLLLRNIRVRPFQLVGEVPLSVIVSFSPWVIGSYLQQKYRDFPITGVDRIDRTSRLLTNLE